MKLSLLSVGTILLFNLIIDARYEPFAAELPKADPEAVGFSKERLERLDLRLKEGIDKSEIPGAVIVIARDGRIVHEREFGRLDPAKPDAMPRDAVFYMASMAKPVTSVALMMLVEEGKVRLTDPVKLYLPELAGIPGVSVETADGAGGKRTQTVPLQSDILIVDLLRHTAGFSNGGTGPGASDPSAAGRAFRDAAVMSYDITSAEQIERLAKVPLASQPGSTFEYGVSTDVLGRVIEVVSGMPLNEFFRFRIADPLRLKVLGYKLDDPARLARPLAADRAQFIDLAKPPRRDSGAGGWFFSTARDYLRFAQMLANGGELDGVRLLSPKTVSLMASNHLPPHTVHSLANPPMSLIAPTAEMGQGFGLGFAVRLAEGGNPAAGSAGDFYWAGASGVYFWIDPQEKLVVVFMAVAPQWDTKMAYRGMVRNLVYQAIVDSSKPRK